MALRRLRRLLRSHWVIVTALGMVGLGAGIFFADMQNQSIEPLYEGTALVNVGSPATDRDRAAVAEQLEIAEDTATRANRDVIDNFLGQVSVDERSGDLLFVSRGETEREALVTAEGMRLAYFEQLREDTADANSGRINEILAEGAALLARLNEMDAEAAALAAAEVVPIRELTAEEQADLDFLQAQIDGLVQRSFSLSADLILAEVGESRSGTVEEITEQLELIAARLDELYEARDRLLGDLEPPDRAGQAPAAAEQETSTEPILTEGRGAPFALEGIEPPQLEGTWTRSALEERLTELETEFETLFAAQNEPPPAAPDLEPVVVDNLTPTRTAPPLSGAVGLLGGALLAAGALAAEDRIRRRVFVGPDAAPLRLLAEMPPATGRLIEGMGGAPARWAPGLQQLRNSILEAADERINDPIVGITPARVSKTEVEALVKDLGQSLAATDRTVLLLDLDFTTSMEDDTDPTTLSMAQLLRDVRRGGDADITRLKTALAESVIPHASFSMIPAGFTTEDPTDVVATAAFATMIQAAREQADIAVIVAPDITDTSAHAMLRKFDHVVVLMRAGRTRWPDFGAAIEHHRENLLGAVLMVGREPRVRRWIPRLRIPKPRLPKIALGRKPKMRRAAKGS